ncbi:GntR family transcriptional regulator [Methylosinus sporium]|uniref:GntR family transcriptional regulator n=1 Tax=Methylosinus sporium TaxID=428 RepID=UPI000D5976FB|nr:GntR family transcriptional regulator [Methylosinus sporium]PWB88650.1 hypothetical protein C5688_19915 [Methylocystis sp. MitZ-2018]
MRVKDDAQAHSVDSAAKSAHVYRTIKDMVIGRALAPGVQINIEDVAASLRVSRTPVREALIRLSCEELIETAPGKGFFVRKRSWNELRADYAYMLLRCAIEGNIVAFNSEGLRRPLPFGSMAERNAASVANTMFLEALYDRIASLAGNVHSMRSVRAFIDRTKHFRDLVFEHPERAPTVAATTRDLFEWLQSHNLEASLSALQTIAVLKNSYIGELAREDATAPGASPTPKDM